MSVANGGHLPWLVDTHTHLDDPVFDGLTDKVLDDARVVGVARCVNIGYRPERWQATRALSARRPEVAVALGLHPAHAEQWSPSLLKALRSELRSSKAVAIGEAGLDYFRPGPSAAHQEEAFTRQIELALELGLPLVIHQRDAERRLLEILASFSLLPSIVLHSFDGSALLAAFAVERGLFVGVGGLATRPRASSLRETLAMIPVERVLLETDSPYLKPHGARGRFNTPSTLPSILTVVAQIWRVSPSQLAAGTSATAYRLFGLGRPVAEENDDGTLTKRERATSTEPHKRRQVGCPGEAQP